MHDRAPDPAWHHDAVIYQLHVKAFRDSNRDGYGDFRGLIEKLDYIAELGVTAIWLLPFYPSPLRDDGYDIADYCGVHPSYGTIADFQELLDKAQAHESNGSETFLLAQAAMLTWRQLGNLMRARGYFEKVRQIEPTVQGRQVQRTGAPGEREVQVVDVKMQNIELVSAFENAFEHQ